MISKEEIEEAVRLLVEAAQPSKIILFGSYARGEAREDSDLDLLVIESAPPSKAREMVRLRNVLRPLRIPMDIVVASDQDIEDWADLPGTLFYWAFKEGKVVHEAAR